MKVLVDTCVWSLALRKRGPTDHPAVHQLSRLLETGEDVVLTGVILQEVLQAFRADSTFRKMADYLTPFTLLPAGRDEHLAAARLHRRSAAAGFSASTMDCLIAATCIQHSARLLPADHDFQRLAEFSKLRLL